MWHPWAPDVPKWSPRAHMGTPGAHGCHMPPPMGFPWAPWDPHGAMGMPWGAHGALGPQINPFGFIWALVQLAKVEPKINRNAVRENKGYADNML